MTSHAVNPAPHRPPNRLAKEASPYLLQHAYNPVDWRPWGDEAFAEARRRDVPILLSIGYSTCYWCHVMERESFEDDSIAHQMNELFVCVKVDREERPDVDDLYMNATLAMTGRGGWPMTVFLDPASLKPFWCGTYFPPRAHHGLPGLPQVLDGVSQAWRTQREAVLAQANQLADAVNEHLAVKFGGAKVTRRHLQSAVEALLQIADRTEGGFGREPKFPQPIFLEYLIDIRAVAGDEQTADAVDIVLKRTLDAMAVGGIFDHVGGGFHRYSVDATWTVPHFEKMLYDNAQLAAVYARAARLYSDAFYARVAIKTLEFVERELTGPAGEFLSALDAEVDAREGLNYLWTPAQVREAVGDANEHQDADLAIAVYGLDRGPNFRDPHHPSEPPTNILRLDTRPERIAARLNLHIDALFPKLDSINAALLAARSKRTQPHLDDKAIAGWNGLMISAFARAAESLDDPRWLGPAKRAARFAAIAPDRRLFDGAALARSWRAGVRGPEGTLEDYALLAHGLLDLARAVPRDDAAEFLTAATSLLTSARAAFRTPEGRWFDTRAGRSDLFIRSASTHDGVIPSGLSAAAHAYSLHYELTGHDVSLTAAAELLQCIAPALSESPTSCAHALRLILRAMTTPQLAAIVAPILGDTADTASSAAADAGSPEPSPSFLPVEVYAAVDRVTVGPDQPASLTLVLKIADGYHITAADPIPPHARAAGINEAQAIEQALFPLRVAIAHGRGVAAYADYPAGTPLGIAGREVMVHTGTIELPVALEYTGSWSGRPIITLSYQACTDRECLLPRTVELDVAIDRA